MMKRLFNMMFAVGETDTVRLTCQVVVMFFIQLLYVASIIAFGVEHPVAYAVIVILQFALSIRCGKLMFPTKFTERLYRSN